jgi:hypothetical protein
MAGACGMTAARTRALHLGNQHRRTELERRDAQTAAGAGRVDMVTIKQRQDQNS